MVIECHPKTPGGYAADTVEIYQGIQWEGVGTVIRQKDLNFDDDIDSHDMGIHSVRLQVCMYLRLRVWGTEAGKALTLAR